MKIRVKYYEKINSPGLNSYKIEELTKQYDDIEITNEGGTQYAVYYIWMAMKTQESVYSTQKSMMTLIWLEQVATMTEMSIQIMTDDEESNKWARHIIKLEKNIKLLDDEGLTYLMEFIIKEMQRRSNRYETEHKRNRQRTRHIWATL